MNISSQLISDAVEALAGLPGIGRRTALRLVLHLVNEEESKTKDLVEKLGKMRKNLRECEVCYNLSDDASCQICNDKGRDVSLLCVVESVREVMAIEATGRFRGLYHVLGGVINPIEGVGPERLEIGSLVARVESGGVGEIILAISPTIEGDTTSFYIKKRLESFGLKITTLARGVAFGGELEYADGVTLGRSIIARVPYQ